VLRAEPQIGKTGTFLCVIHKFLERVGSRKVFLLPRVPPANLIAWQLPDNKLFGRDYGYGQPLLLGQPKVTGKYGRLVGSPYMCESTRKVPDLGTSSHDGYVALQANPILADCPASAAPGPAACSSEDDSDSDWDGGAEQDDTSFGEHVTFQVVRAAVDARTHPVAHRAECPACKSSYEALPDPTELKVAVATCGADSDVVSITVSLPESVRAAYPRFRGDGNGGFPVHHRVAYWVFVPSIRPKEARLNYAHALYDEDIKGAPVTAIQAVVVRRGDYDEFRKNWGKSHVVVCLPDELSFLGEVSTVGNGVGHARRVIHALASALGLPAVFMVDDNVESFLRVTTRVGVVAGDDAGSVAGAGAGAASGAVSSTAITSSRSRWAVVPCSLAFVLLAMQRVLTEDPEDFTMSGAAHWQPEEPSSIAEHTGGKDKYAVLGVGRLRHRPGRGGLTTVRCLQPFRERHVFSVTLVNIAALNRFSYPPWPFWEVRCARSLPPPRGVRVVSRLSCG
jgi:hypothetical protein